VIFVFTGTLLLALTARQIEELYRLLPTNKWNSWSSYFWKKIVYTTYNRWHEWENNEI